MLELSEPIESYQELCHRLQLNSGIPYVEKWSAAADFLQLITDVVEVSKPSLIMECGSGLSTVMLAAACRKIGQGKVISLDHEQEYASRTQQALEAYGLDEIATVIYSPLVSYQLNGEQYQWYEVGQLEEVAINMLIIDGPPGPMQKHSRYPVLPILFSRLADGCNIFLDDASRDDEREIVRMWERQFPGLTSRYIETERGCTHIVLGGY